MNKLIKIYLDDSDIALANIIQAASKDAKPYYLITKEQLQYVIEKAVIKGIVDDLSYPAIELLILKDLGVE